MNLKNNNDNISRRSFIKIVVSAFSLLFIYVWYKFVKNEKYISENRLLNISISNEITQGITFFDSFIIYKNQEVIKIFSSKCTHLGCKISKVENNILVCPCHGSQFSVEGKVIIGPASEDLRSLKYKIDNNKIIISL